jgi:hypothetical protein
MKSKNLNFPFLLAGLFVSFLGTAHAQTITALGTTESNQMPGSATDFTFFGSNSQGDGGQPTVLNDFSVQVDTSSYGGNANYSVITDPAGNTAQTGIFYGNGLLATFTLGNSPSFDYSNFTVYVTYGNDTEGNIRDASLTLTLNPDGTPTSLTQPVVEPAVRDTTMASYAAFQITGATAGETLQLLATPLPGGYTAYSGGVSFSSGSVPEPGTWAMMALGTVLLLGLVRRQKLVS